ncbi:MAG: cation-translocating P-type ATPase, partial [Verrucomicrobia bacterium]|nr:cation-translocating P-type ATPase [Verrucomicrobiota bacterium]
MACPCKAWGHPALQNEEMQERQSMRQQTVLTSVCLASLAAAWVGGVSRPGFSGETQAVFYGIAYLAGGFYPTMGVWNDLRSLRFNVNFLMVAAALGAAAIGQAVEGAVLMFLFSLSGALESFANGRTRRAIRSLMALSPSAATVLRDDLETTVPVASLKVDDVLIVRPGNAFAADGVILEGNTSVDESSLTGEAMPVDRGPGNRVMAGTVNRFGAVKFRMDRPVTDTTLAKIFRIVEEAQQKKAPTHRLIEKYGGPYTWLILAATLLTFLWELHWKHEPWRDSLYRSMTLMVVASPCALVLSIPSAVLAAIAAGAWRGILFKGGRAMEIIGQARAVAFDKTGTLTEGKPHLSDTRFAAGVLPEEVMADVASVEQNSEHPLAEVLVGEARSRGIAFVRAAESRVMPGMGVEGMVNGKHLRVGAEAFVCGPDGMDAWVRDALDEFHARGLTCLVAAGEKPLAVFGVADQLRPGSLQAIRELNRLGIKPVMLTGDHAASAAEFARQLGIVEFRASLLPHQKVEAVRELEQQFKTVAMVGDG